MTIIGDVECSIYFCRMPKTLLLSPRNMSQKKPPVKTLQKIFQMVICSRVPKVKVFKIPLIDGVELFVDRNRFPFLYSGHVHVVLFGQPQPGLQLKLYRDGPGIFFNVV